MNKLSSALYSVWNAFDIGKDAEPEEYAGKPIAAWYDSEHTLESSVVNAWEFLVTEAHPSETVASLSNEAAEFVSEKKTWLLDLSKASLNVPAPQLQG